MNDLESFDEKIIQLVKTNLPGLQADAIINIIEDLKKSNFKNKQLNEENSNLKNKQIDTEKLIKAYVKQIEELNNKIKYEDNIEQLQKEILDKEIKLNLTISEIKLEQAEKRADSIYKLTEIAFKNPSRITREFADLPGHYNSGNNGGGSGTMLMSAQKTIMQGDDITPTTPKI